MTVAARFWRDTRGSAAEFALVLPALLALLLGTIDVGRFMWFVGQAEKATQVGTRYAVVTDMVPSGLRTYSFAASGGLTQGTVVPVTSFPGVSCSSSGGTATCVCASGGTCSFPLTANQTAFDNIVAQMREIYGGIGEDNVQISYDWSGLGYAGDPNGADVQPIVTVRLVGLTFRPIIFGTLGSVGVPGTTYSLTLEDGQGSYSN